MVKKSHSSFQRSVFSMAMVAMFIALYGVLSLLHIYITKDLRISFTFMPVALAAMMFGPITAGIAGALGDIAGWLINPGGNYFPGFTVSGFVSGVIYGLFLYRKEITWKRIVFSAVAMVFIVEVGLNPVWLNIMYGTPYMAFLWLRLVKAAILIPLQVFLIYSTKDLVKKFAPAR